MTYPYRCGFPRCEFSSFSKAEMDEHIRQEIIKAIREKRWTECPFRPYCTVSGCQRDIPSLMTCKGITFLDLLEPERRPEKVSFT